MPYKKINKDSPRKIKGKVLVVEKVNNIYYTALLEDGEVQEIYFAIGKEVLGNIYQGKVEKVLPGMQAAFINIGEVKNAYLSLQELDILYDLEDSVKDEILKQTKKIKLQENQKIPVQVIRDKRESKGAKIFLKLSIPGKFLVLFPGINFLAVSRKIQQYKTRDKLLSNLYKFKEANEGLIARTSSQKATLKELKNDYLFLKDIWSNIKQELETSPAPKLVYRDFNLVYRTVRDLLNFDTKNLIINNKEDYEEIIKYLQRICPRLVKKIKFSNEKSLFNYYYIDKAIDLALKRKIYLSGGSYLVMDKTEAVTVIDVNSGGFVGRRNFEDTALKVNLFAAKEIARQLRIRDIGGIIIIDFIDMKYQNNQEYLLKKFKEYLNKDRSKVTVVSLTKLGLVQMTRKRVGGGIEEALLQYCPKCDGKGQVVNHQFSFLFKHRS